jgi:23S rRNA pseudouridine1911/1915/1917 synthase
MATELDILLEDNHCLAVNKPAPLLTQAPPGVPSLEALVKAYIKERHGKTGNVYLGIPHRLDRPVSGVILFARNSKSARRLAEQFHARQVTKVYWGAVEGTPTPAEGTWEDWLRKQADQARTERAEPGSAGARHARLRYRNLHPCEGGTLVEFCPETGRMHQIRAQTAWHGWPLRGDVLYGSKLPFGPPAALPRERIIALHARALTFLHPLRYEPITLSAPLPAAWRELGIEANGTRDAHVD